MKKGLLLSVVASGLIYAGGDIAPAQPVAPQAAPAACDFWGTLALRYDAIKDDVTGLNFGDAGNNFAAAALAMGVEKELGYGFGFGAEADAVFLTDGKFNKINGVPRERGELMQAYLTYKAGNTAIKLGRQALPKAVSPWAFTERDTLGGVPARTFNGITLVNTDIKDTTLVAAWVASLHDFYQNGNTKINGSDKGLFALGVIYKGIANTTISDTLYYIPKNGSNGKAISNWLTIKGKINNIDLGLQAAYAKADPGSIAQIGNGTKSSFGIAACAGTKFDAFDVKLTLAYLNDGDARLTLPNSTAATLTGEATSAFWGASYRAMGGNVSTTNGKQKIARLDMGYTLPNNYGRIYGGVAVDRPDTGSTALAARVGYDFTVKGIAAKVEYRYHKDFNSNKDHRIRVQGVYKF